MTDVPFSQAEVKSLCAEMRRYGEPISIATAWKVLRHIGDRRLAVDALLMQKRPKWLEEMVGPKKEKE